MTEPLPGNYYIINKQTAPDGSSLAVTFNGKDATLTVTKLTHVPNQQWKIINHSGKTQRVVPEEYVNLQVAFQGPEERDGTLTVIPGDGNFWNIRGTDGVYTIQDGDFTIFWGLGQAAEGGGVYYGPACDIPLHYWGLMPA